MDQRIAAETPPKLHDAREAPVALAGASSSHRGPSPLAAARRPVLKSPGLAAGHRRSRMEFERKWVPSKAMRLRRGFRRVPPGQKSKRTQRIRCPRQRFFLSDLSRGSGRLSQGLGDPRLTAAQGSRQLRLTTVLARVEELAKPCGPVRGRLLGRRLRRRGGRTTAVTELHHHRELQRHPHPSVSPGRATKFSQSRTELHLVMGFPS